MPANTSRFSSTVAGISPASLVIFGVAKHAEDEHFLGPVIDVRNQPAPVVRDIENHARTYRVRVLPSESHICKVAPIRSSRGPIPDFERSLPFAMRRDGFFDAFTADNAHCRSSHFVKLESRCARAVACGNSVNAIGYLILTWKT